jgi:hypothetical protein
MQSQLDPASQRQLYAMRKLLGSLSEAIGYLLQNEWEASPLRYECDVYSRDVLKTPSRFG